jgi:hypothetical protein
MQELSFIFTVLSALVIFEFRLSCLPAFCFIQFCCKLHICVACFPVIQVFGERLRSCEGDADQGTCILFSLPFCTVERKGVHTENGLFDGDRCSPSLAFYRRWHMRANAKAQPVVYTARRRHNLGVARSVSKKRSLPVCAPTTRQETRADLDLVKRARLGPTAKTQHTTQMTPTFS